MVVTFFFLSDKSSSASALSAGTGSGITIGAVFLLILVGTLIGTFLFFRRSKQAPDTVPIIPRSSSPSSSVTFANLPNEYGNQMIEGAVGGAMCQLPPVYTPTEIKVPFDGGIGVSATGPTAPVVPLGHQAASAAVVPQGAEMGPPNGSVIGDNGTTKHAASAGLELEGATLDQVSL